MISIDTPYSHKIQLFQSQNDIKSRLVPAKDLVEILLRTLNALYLREHLSVDKDLTPPLRSGPARACAQNLHGERGRLASVAGENTGKETRSQAELTAS